MQPQFISTQFVHFIENNVKKHPGKTGLKFNIVDIRNNYKVGMYSLETGFTMNDDMAVFLNENKDIEVSVITG